MQELIGRGEPRVRSIYLYFIFTRLLLTSQKAQIVLFPSRYCYRSPYFVFQFQFFRAETQIQPCPSQTNLFKNLHLEDFQSPDLRHNFFLLGPSGTTGWRQEPGTIPQPGLPRQRVLVDVVTRTHTYIHYWSICTRFTPYAESGSMGRSSCSIREFLDVLRLR